MKNEYRVSYTSSSGVPTIIKVVETNDQWIGINLDNVVSFELEKASVEDRGDEVVLFLYYNLGTSTHIVMPQDEAEQFLNTIGLDGRKVIEEFKESH